MLSERDSIAITDGLLKGIPDDIRIVMAWDTLLATNLDEDVLLRIGALLHDRIEAGKDLEVNFDFDKVMEVQDEHS